MLPSISKHFQAFPSISKHFQAFWLDCSTVSNVSSPKTAAMV